MTTPTRLREFEFKDQFGEIDSILAKDSKDAWRVLAADLGAPQQVVKKFFKRVR